MCSLSYCAIYPAKSDTRLHVQFFLLRSERPTKQKLTPFERFWVAPREHSLAVLSYVGSGTRSPRVSIVYARSEYTVRRCGAAECKP